MKRVFRSFQDKSPARATAATLKIALYQYTDAALLALTTDALVDSPIYRHLPRREIECTLLAAQANCRRSLEAQRAG